MLLHELLDATPVLDVVPPAPAARVAISDVTHDHRAVGPGALFCCVRGRRTDGHRFAAAAVAQGAAALLVEELVADVPDAVVQVRVASVRVAMGPLAARLWGEPSLAVPVAGVTGTNGKTTTTFLLDGIATAAGLVPATIGTPGVRLAGEAQPGSFTTPEAPDLQRLLRRLVDSGATFVAMEVSSHALSERRVDGTRFAAAAFTNLTPEHLDHHGSVDEYFAAKARLFDPSFTSRAVVNVDDERGPVIASRARAQGVSVLTTAIEGPADLRARVVAGDAVGTQVVMTGDCLGAAVEVRVGLPGRFNVENALTAAGVAVALGVEQQAIVAGLERVPAVPGRFEIVRPGAPVTVVVDYAHTPDGIRVALAAARDLTEGRVIAVFGCGGDRDPAKRPAMGRAAGEGADVVVLTSDNPRSESPAAIAAAARVGLDATGAETLVELDRRAAIRAALARARHGDVVMILGKGAETGQCVGDRVVPFDDRSVAGELMESAWS